MRNKVFIFSTANFLQYTILVAGIVNYPEFLTNGAGFSESYSGMLVGLIALSNLLAVLPLGLVSDRLSPKRIFQISQAGTMIFFLLLCFVRVKSVAWAIFILGGISFSGSRILLQVLYFKYLPEKKRSANVSVFLSSGFLGFSAGGMLTGTAQAYNVYLPFFLASGLSFFAFLLSFMLPDSKPEKIHILDYPRDILHPKVMLVIIVFILMGMHFGVEQYGFPKLVMDELKISSRGMGYLYLSIGLCMAGVAFMCREYFETRARHFYYFGIGLIVSGAFQGITAAASGFYSLLFIRLGHVMGDSLTIIMSAVVVAGFFPRVRMGGNVGMIQLLNSCGQFFGAYLTGECIEQAALPVRGIFSPYRIPFTISGVIMVCAGLMFMTFMKRLGVADKQ